MDVTGLSAVTSSRSLHLSNCTAFLRPKIRLDIQFKHRLNQATEVMTENLAEGFVDLRRFGFASQRIAKLCLDHAECRFDVASLVVLLKKPPLIKFVVVVHLSPEIAFPLPFRFFVLSSLS